MLNHYEKFKARTTPIKNGINIDFRGDGKNMSSKDGKVEINVASKNDNIIQNQITTNKTQHYNKQVPNIQIDPNLTAISNNLSTTKCTNEINSGQNLI